MDIDAISFSRTDNWVKREAGKPDVIYRFLESTKTHVYMMEIGRQQKDGSFRLHPPPKTTGLRRRWRKREVTQWANANRLERVQERGIPEPMQSAAKSELEGAAQCDDILAMKREVVAYVNEQHGASWIWSHRVYKEAVRDAVNAFATSKKTIENWLEYDLFYGGHPYANMPHHWLKGGPNQPKPERRDERGRLQPRGRPTSAERIDPDTKDKRRTCSEAMRTKWQNFVYIEGLNTDDNLSSILERFKKGQVASNRVAGVPRVYPANRRLPRDSYMKDLGRPILRKAQQERAAKRSNEPGGRRMLAGGSATMLANDDLNVLDLDATIVDNTIQYSGEDIYIDGYGKATILLAIDRASSLVLGWYVTFGYENGDCYRRLLFCAYTPKMRELTRWGVPHLISGMAYGQAAVVFVDRGPGMSEAVQKAAVNGLNGDLKFARPGDPQAKGHVEGGMQWVQQALSHLPGSTHTTGDADIDRKRRLASKTTGVSLEVFMQTLLTAIFIRNTTMNVEHLLTDAMLSAKKPPKPVPIDIYNFNKAKRGGDFGESWSEEEVFRRLNDEHVLCGTGGVVTLKKRQFSSPLLKAVATHFKIANPGRDFNVKVYSIANAPLNLLWEDPTGELRALVATERTAANYPETFAWAHDFINTLKRARYEAALRAAKAAIDKAKESSAAAVSLEQERVLKRANTRRTGASGAPVATRAAAKVALDRDDVRSIVEGLAKPSVASHDAETPSEYPTLVLGDND
jgi:hypothetical protein